MASVTRRTGLATLATALAALALSGVAAARIDEAPTGQDRAAATAGRALASALAQIAPQQSAFAPKLLTERLAKALTVPNVAAATSGAVVIDLETGELVFEQNSDSALVPASNEKL